MNNPINTKEAAKKKDQLTKEISILINKFQTETGYQITSIDMQTIDGFGIIDIKAGISI